MIDDNDGINKRRSIDFSRNQVGIRKDIIILPFKLLIDFIYFMRKY